MKSSTRTYSSLAVIRQFCARFAGSKRTTNLTGFFICKHGNSLFFSRNLAIRRVPTFSEGVRNGR